MEDRQRVVVAGAAGVSLSAGFSRPRTEMGSPDGEGEVPGREDRTVGALASRSA